MQPQIGLPGMLQKGVLCDYNVITRIFEDMRTELIRIGNSRGVRIPKPLIEQCGLGDTVELRVDNDCLVISRERRPREGWGEAFRKAGPAAHEELLLETAEPNEFDGKEWKW